MFVPADGLNGQSPESKGADYLKRLFTFVAIRIVQAQLEGLGNDGGFAPQATGMDGSVQSPDYSDLRRAMEEVPLGDGDEWLEALLQENPRLSLRILEVRSEYCSDFDYGELKRLTEMEISEGSTKLMQQHIMASSGLTSEGQE